MFVTVFKINKCSSDFPESAKGQGIQKLGGPTLRGLIIKKTLLFNPLETQG